MDINSVIPVGTLILGGLIGFVSSRDSQNSLKKTLEDWEKATDIKFSALHSKIDSLVSGFGIYQQSTIQTLATHTAEITQLKQSISKLEDKLERIKNE